MHGYLFESARVLSAVNDEARACWGLVEPCPRARSDWSCILARSSLDGAGFDPGHHCAYCGCIMASRCRYTAFSRADVQSLLRVIHRLGIEPFGHPLSS